MFKLPITKNGDIKIFEVIKYSVLIALFVVGYIELVNSYLLTIILQGVSILLTCFILLTLELVLIASLKLFQVLTIMIKPIIKYVDSLYILCFDIEKIQSLFDKEFIISNQNMNIKLSVFRC